MIKWKELEKRIMARNSGRKGGLEESCKRVEDKKAGRHVLRFFRDVIPSLLYIKHNDGVCQVET